MSEHSLNFGPEAALVGTINVPSPEHHRIGVVLFNAGFATRVGPNRLNVRLARQFADQGFPSIRFDLSGLGDSLRPTDAQPETEQVQRELGAALDTLQARTGCNRFVVLGMCSGTDPCIRFGSSDRRLCGMILLDPFSYPTWRSRINSALRRVVRHGSSGTLRQALLRAVLRSAKPSLRVARPLDAELWDELRPKPPRAVFAESLRLVLANGISILIVYTNHAERLHNYAGQFQQAHTELRSFTDLQVELHEGSNHTYSDLDMQLRLFDTVNAWLNSLELDRRRQ